MSGLPTSWADIELSVVAQVTSGIGFPNEYQGHTSGDLPFFKVSDISHAVLANRGELKTANHYVSHEVAEKLKGKPLAPGSTVFAKIGEAVRLNRRATVTTPCLIDNNVMAVKARDGVDDRYVHQFLRTIDFGESARSTTVPSLRKGDVEELRFPLAPAAEQKRIADKLDTVLTRVDAVNTRLARVAPLLKRFRQSVLAAATSGRLTEDWRAGQPDISEWKTEKLNDLGELGRGKSKHRPRNDPRLYGGVHPFVQTGDVANANQWITSHKQTYSDFGLDQSKLWPANTLCITIAANIADTALLSYPACFPDSVVGFVANEACCLPRFIKWSIDVRKDDLERLAPATAQKNINLGVLEEVEIHLPSLEEQTEIVRRVETLFAFADRLEARLAQAQTAATRLTPALLAKAFRGELVPQDPNDEPAAELLRRLQQKASSNSEKRRRKSST